MSIGFRWRPGRVYPCSQSVAVNTRFSYPPRMPPELRAALEDEGG